MTVSTRSLVRPEAVVAAPADVVKARPAAADAAVVDAVALGVAAVTARLAVAVAAAVDLAATATLPPGRRRPAEELQSSRSGLLFFFIFSLRHP
jgi:hypothetical protein